MKTILGLDQGVNSIGWSLTRFNGVDKGRILASGVRIFPEGVENIGQGEKEQSRNASRRDARQQRRQLYRTRMRKNHLLKRMHMEDMAPVSSIPTKDNAIWNVWVKMNPYTLRNDALHRELSQQEIGRIFYHLAQRRGYLSNSRNNDLKEDSTIKTGKDGMSGIDATETLLTEDTLGSAMYKLLPEDNTPFKQNRERVRARYTTRAMYIDEFERIWEKQSSYHDWMTPKLKEDIGGRKKDGYDKDGILFFQRPLRAQKYLIGKCIYHSNKRRRAISAPDYEEFVIHQFVNNIRVSGRALQAVERERAIYFLLRKSKKQKFKALRKGMKMQDASLRFNFEDDDYCPFAYTIGNLSSKKAFGERWFRLSEEERDQIWHDIEEYNGISELHNRMQGKWGLEEETAAYISKLKLKEGYGSLSKKAISNILPFLKQGYSYHIATPLGGIIHAMSNEKWSALSDQKQQEIKDTTESIVSSSTTGSYIDTFKDYLKSSLQLNEDQLTQLYHHSININQETLRDKLPTGAKADRRITGIRNPVVTQALFELRKLVNTLIDKHGKIDAIKIELGRDLKMSKKQRYEYRRKQKKREKYNESVILKLIEKNITVNHRNILKYKLWEECQRICPFTGSSISCTDLFENALYEIEHIIPYSRSLDDSFNNLTLCHVEINREKSKQTPHEYYLSKYGQDKWQEVTARAIKLFHTSAEWPNRYRKFQRFTLKNVAELDGFISRQLNDTRYIARESKEYLSQICHDVQVMPGQLTAKLRHYWGLNTYLGSNQNEKDREDQRHHALDAMVVAVTNRSHLQKISHYNRYKAIDDSNKSREHFPDPWPSFRSDVKQSLDKILVSYKQNNRVVTKRMVKNVISGQAHHNHSFAARGMLHKESVYGKREWLSSTAYHIRKPLTSFTDKAQILKIVDPSIRRLLEDRLSEHGVDLDKKYKVPKTAFAEPIFLKNRNGQDVPIRKIRIKENFSGAEQLKDELNQQVNLDNNHHILIYLDTENTLREYKCSFWEAVERVRQGIPIYKLPENGEKMVAKLHKNDMFLIGYHSDLKDSDQIQTYLYRVQKISSSNYMFRHHLASTTTHKDQMVNIQSMKAWEKHHIRPVRQEIDGTLMILE